VAGVQDGHTRKLDRSQVSQSLFLARYRASLVVVDGHGAGNEHLLERTGMTLGRGPDVDIVIEDDSMSREHVAFDASAEGFRVRDLGSTNGMTLNGSRVAAADLKHGDRLGLGEHTFQYVIEKRERVGTYDLSGS
jgi:pSer/pThr/pTyr-binding forkhead associated (FHA) protein